ncbi:MAG TPA: hypothetical protein PK897_06005, partial [Treponema sp.]|nr:hypothetical protein [Treponema sp.]
MLKRFVSLSILSFLTFLPLWAQAQQPVLAVLPFSSPNDLQNEALQIEKLVQSYITELHLFRLVATADRDKILSEWEFSVNETL